MAGEYAPEGRCRSGERATRRLRAPRPRPFVTLGLQHPHHGMSPLAVAFYLPFRSRLPRNLPQTAHSDAHTDTRTLTICAFLQAGSITAKELKECFSALDLDGDGLLSRKELALAVRALGTPKGLPPITARFVLPFTPHGPPSAIFAGCRQLPHRLLRHPFANARNTVACSLQRRGAATICDSQPPLRCSPRIKPHFSAYCVPQKGEFRIAATLC